MRYPEYPWHTTGISLIWDYDALMKICNPKQVVPLSVFFDHYNKKWEHIDDIMVQDGRTLVVAGLDVALDGVDTDKIIEWIEETLYPVVCSYQSQVADGGGEAALVFYFARPERFKRQSPVRPDYDWIAKDHSRHEILRAIYNGAYQDAKTLEQNEKAIGIYLRRIS